MKNHTQVKNVGHISEFPQIWSTTDIIFCHLRPFFTLLPHYWPWNLKFGKNVKNTWRHYPFTHVYHKSRSYAYDVWFLRYKVKWTEFFVILSHFLPFNLLTIQKIKILKNKKSLEILSFYTCVPNANHMMYDSWDIDATDRIFSHFGLFFALLPL